MSRIKTGRALIFVVSDRYEIVLTISLSLKASIYFPIGNFGSKMVKKSEYLGNCEISQTVIFYFQCVSSIIIHFVSTFRWAFSIYSGFPMKKDVKSDDVIESNVRVPKFEDLFFYALG